MDIKVNNMQPVTQVPDTAPVESGDGSFKFTLSSAITDANLQAKIDMLMMGKASYKHCRNVLNK